MRNFTIRTLLVLACLCPGLARAADCSLKMVNTVPIELVDNGTRVVVPVIINGTKETFVLDTGGALTQISASTAKDLNLPIGDSGTKLLDMYGRAMAGVAHIDTFTLGRLHDKKTEIQVSPFTFGNTYVGLLAADYMGEYDVELDFRGGKMNYFSPDHCEGQVVYWPTAAVAVVPTRLQENHLTLSVMLDGHPIKAMIDTGATNTFLTTGAAKQAFDITADSPGAKQLGGSDNDRTFEYVFQKLSFEGLEVQHPHIVVLPDKTGSKDPNNDYVTGSRVHRVDDPDSGYPVMEIGMNILSKLHLYIAFNEHKIYITPASPPPVQPQTTPAQ